MLALRASVIALLVAGCSPELVSATAETPRLPAHVGPPLGESTAMGPADSTRPVAVFPGSAPEDVGPGLAISGTGTAPETQQPPAAQTQPEEGDYSGFLYAPYGPEGPSIPIEQQQPPPPVFQPPPPPPAPDLSDRVFSD